MKSIELWKFFKVQLSENFIMSRKISFADENCESYFEDAKVILVEIEALF